MSLKKISGGDHEQSIVNEVCVLEACSSNLSHMPFDIKDQCDSKRQH